MRYLHRFLLIAFLLAMPLAASAQQAFTIRDTEVFAGPSSEFPPVAVLRANSGVRIAGCLADWSWCDIIVSNLRGWVYAGDLVVPYQNDRVAVVDYGPQLGFAIVAFSLHSYWGQHYRGRPWYGEREQWASRVRIEGDRGGPPPRGRAPRARGTEPQQGERLPQAGAPPERSRETPESGRSAPGAGGKPPVASPRPQTGTPPTDEGVRRDRAVKPPQGRPSPGAGGTPPATVPRPQQEGKPQTDDGATSGRTVRPPQGQPSPKAGQPGERSKKVPEAGRSAPGAGGKPPDNGPRSGGAQKKDQGARGGDKSQGGKKDRDRD
jgi:uncharacterized protein YraI